MKETKNSLQRINETKSWFGGDSKMVARERKQRV
jgi:hypothetical protein